MLEDPNLKELLELIRGWNVIHFAGQRALIFDAASRSSLLNRPKNFGKDALTGPSAAMGISTGRRLAETMKHKFKWHSNEGVAKASVHARIYACRGVLCLDPNGPIKLVLKAVPGWCPMVAEQHLLLKALG